MIKQKLIAALLIFMNHAAFRFANKSVHITHITTAANLKPVQLLSKIESLYSLPHYIFIYLTTKVQNAIDANFHNQILQADRNSEEGSTLYSYNFTGTPQSLFLLPGRKQEAKTILQQNSK